MEIDMITQEQLQSFFEDTNEEIIEKFVDPLNAAFERFEINTPQRIAMFLAQVGHESAGLTAVRENLNYKAATLSKVFPKYFRDRNPADYERQPEKIANLVYGNRMGNGPEESGDGYKYRGRGLIQLTGHDNYNAFANSMGMAIDEAVQYLETPEGAAMSAAWFWNSRKLNAVADAGDIVKSTKLINGGTIGLEERTELYEEALEIFG
jgi:putative chitinase